MSGARKEAMALTNWPKVSADDSSSSLTTVLSNGVTEVCINVLPMPSSEKAASIPAKLLLNTGNSRAAMVTHKLSSSVRLRPILFMSMLVGTLKSKNQKNTSEGRKLAVVSVS